MCCKARKKQLSTRSSAVTENRTGGMIANYRYISDSDFDELPRLISEQKEGAIILSELESFDHDKAVESFNITECKDIGLYPNI